MSYQYKNSHYKDKTVSWSCYLYNGNPIPGKTVLILRRGPGKQWRCTHGKIVAYTPHPPPLQRRFRSNRTTLVSIMKYLIDCVILRLNKHISQIPQCTKQMIHTVHISVTKSCIVGYGTDALWDLWIRSISQEVLMKLIRNMFGCCIFKIIISRRAQWVIEHTPKY